MNSNSSLIKDIMAQQSPRRLKSSVENELEGRRWIHDVGEFRSGLIQACNARMAAPDALEDAFKKKFRTKDRMRLFAVKDLIGKADQGLWAQIANSTLDGMLKNINASQQSEGWVIASYDTEIVTDNSGIDHLILAIRWVDMLNQPETKYKNGHVNSVHVDVNSTLDPAIVEALKARTGGDDDMKKVIAMMAEILSKQAAPQHKPLPAPATKPAKDDF